MSSDRIVAVDAWTVDIPLTDPFVISRGAMEAARSVFVRVTLEAGAAGFGEAAPFAALTAETVESTLAALQVLRDVVTGRRASDWRGIGEALRAVAPGAPAARAALECATIDALARSRGEPLYRTLGGADVRARETDITLPLLAESRIDSLASDWYAAGFRVFKMKVGASPDADAARVRRLAARYPDVGFVLDANQGFDLASAREFLGGLSDLRERVLVFEQPVARRDLGGMAALRATAGVPVAADESVFSLADAHDVIAAGAADMVNLKIMKCGFAETIAIAGAVRAAGLGLMIGGMMESRLGMSFSFALVLGLGGIGHLDLDTPLLLATDPLDGGYRYDGPRLRVWEEPGVGATPRVRPGPR